MIDTMILIFKKSVILFKYIFSEEYDEMGSLMRSCSGEVSVNKCEGICNSQVQPSVVTPTGFLKVPSYILSIYISYVVCNKVFINNKIR